MSDDDYVMRKNVHGVLRIAFITGFLLVATTMIMKKSKPYAQSAHRIPTLLSVVDPITKTFIPANDNPLYRELEELPVVHLNTLLHEPPTLQIVEEDHSIQDFPSRKALRESLRLVWTLGRTESGKAVVRDDDVIALYCTDGESMNRDEGTLLEAATIEQARATSQFDASTSMSNNEWYIPAFPVLWHDTCQFVLYQRGQHELHFLARSQVYDLRGTHSIPAMIHLALGNHEREMILRFSTGEKIGTPVALYGTRSANLKVEGTSTTYTAQDMCGAPANQTGKPGAFLSPGRLHTIRLSNLQPGTVYQYKVGIAAGQGIIWSDTYTFTLPPKKDPFSYIVYADQGCPANGWGHGASWTAAMTAREIHRSNLPARLVHHIGDLSYAVGSAHIWDEWMNMISSFTPKVPFMIAVGNNDYDHVEGGEHRDPSGVKTPHGYMPEWGNFGNDSGGECGVPVSKRFTMPSSKDSNGVFWYSYDYSMVHTTVVSSEHDLSPGSVQYEWLQQDLAAVNRQETPWLILEMHRPLYEAQKDDPSTVRGGGNQAVNAALRMELEDLLHDYHVDLVLTGHYHAYFRTCDGLYKSTCHQGGPMHITVGTSGASFTMDDLIENDWTAAFVRGQFGYGRITVYNATSLHFEFVKAGSSTDPTAGTVKDDVWVQRQRETTSILRQDDTFTEIN